MHGQGVVGKDVADPAGVDELRFEIAEHGGRVALAERALVIGKLDQDDVGRRRSERRHIRYVDERLVGCGTDGRLGRGTGRRPALLV
jgi:hypothetical protein